MSSHIRAHWAAITAASLTLFASVPGLAGPRDSGGGDLCEDRIKIIRDDVKSWIQNGGPAGLDLPSGISVLQYSNQMIAQISSAKIRCVGPNDEGYPVKINDTPKVCRFDQKSDAGQITCDIEKFNLLNESGQYVLVHHEFAGLAGVELPNGDDSNYPISNQISEYLVDQVVKKLAIRRAATKPGLSSEYQTQTLEAEYGQILKIKGCKTENQAEACKMAIEDNKLSVLDVIEVEIDDANGETTAYVKVKSGEIYTDWLDDRNENFL